MAKLIDALAITTAVSAVVSAPVSSGVNGASALIQIDFVYGSGGTSGKVWVQTSLDGSTWIDAANMTFTTASKSRLQNISSRTVITTPYTVTDGTLTDDTVHDGVIGTFWRTKLTTVGTYAATSLTVTVLPGP